MTMSLSPDVVLTGVPRSGTTLCCKLLGDAVDTVALFEPMQVERLPVDDRPAAIAQISGFFAASRESLCSEQRAFSQQIDGRIPDNPIAADAAEGGLRPRLAARGEIVIDKPLSAGFKLVIKHNATFIALLPELALAFHTVAVIRNPLAVLASWNSVDLPVAEGRVPMAERLLPALAQRLDAKGDRVSRQLVLLDWMFGAFHMYVPASRVLRYEEVVASSGRSLGKACGVELSPSALMDRNTSLCRDPAFATKLADRLLSDTGAWRLYYSERDVHALLDRADRTA